MSYFYRTLRRAAAAGVVFSLCVVGASAVNYGVGTVNGDGLRLRAEASTDSSILGRAYTGDQVIVLEDAKDGWYKVNYECVEGYMSAEYLGVLQKADAELGYGKVSADGSVLNMRSGPGTSYDRTKKIPDGTVVKLIGMDSGWFKIEYKDTKGYVSSDYITICPEKEAAPAASPSKYETAQARSQNASGVWGNGVSTALGLQIVEYGKAFLGTPYVYGGNGPDCFDCSGFTKYVYSHFGYSISRTASNQMKNGVSVSSDQLQAGDLIFFRNPGDNKPASHVGIYIADGKFVHASSDRYVVEIDTLYSSYNSRTYVGAQRII